ncbi:MAG: FAD-dependent oxidoreductase [Nanoarchaeota archaeon]|nr:FAD-dependent oxidoreductase [Nanoarchaeota archaeon]
MEPIKFISRLLEIEVINEETKVLDFSVPDNFNFVAGQYVRMAFYMDEKRILRSYSIFSSPFEKGHIKIYFKRVKDGYASNFLFNMKVGEEIEMKGPFGNFVFNDISKDTIFISSGTGFGPFMSIVKDLDKKNHNKKLILIRGYRNEKSLVGEEELQKMNGENFVHYNVLSQPEDEKYSLKGYVQDFLIDLVPKGFKGDFYVCGLKEMVLSVIEKLELMGVSGERIHIERYD